jgi:hypothetical protein
MMLAVSGGDYPETYELRDDAFKKGRSCRTNSDNGRIFFLSKVEGDHESPLLPLPPGLSPPSPSTLPSCPVDMK